LIYGYDNLSLTNLLLERGTMINDNDDNYGFDNGEMEKDADCGENITKRRVFFRVAALIILLSFIGLIAVTSFQTVVRNASLAGIISESLHIKKNIDDNLMQAVVKVQVVARKDGLGVEQRRGTGFNIYPQGVIVTNNHLVEGAINVLVEFPDGMVFKAVNWSGSSEYDLAVINLGSAGLPVVALDERGAPQPGERITVVGNPLSLNNIVVQGTVSEYLIVGDRAVQVFTIDAPIYSGNSGSPVYSRDGRVVGVVFATLRRTVNGEDKVEGMAIPVIELNKLVTR